MTDRPVVTTHPALRWGQPCIRDRRVEDLAGTHWAGDDACDEYDVTRAELLLACWHIGWHGIGGGVERCAWRRRWGEWAAQWAVELAREQYDDIPDPPRRQT